MAYLTSQLAWFWETFQWAGVLGVGLLTWFLAAVGFNLYRQLAGGRAISIPLIIAGAACVVMIGALIAYSRSEAAVTPPTPVAGQAEAIPGIPATKGGLSNVLDTLLPKISELMSHDARRAVASFQQMPGEALDELLKVGPVPNGQPGPRELAAVRVKTSVDLLTNLQKKMSDLRDQNKLNQSLIEWTFGDFNTVLRAIGNSEALSQQMSRITLPPEYNPPQLAQFWEFGRNSAALRDEVRLLNDWISAVESRVQKVQTEFGRRVSQ